MSSLDADTHVTPACVLGAIAPSERIGHIALSYKLFSRLVKERVEIANGTAFRFSADDFEKVARFVANERKCCPFLHIEIDLEAGNGPIWLRLTAPAGMQERGA